MPAVFMRLKLCLAQLAKMKTIQNLSAAAYIMFLSVVELYSDIFIMKIRLSNLGRNSKDKRNRFLPFSRTKNVNLTKGDMWKKNLMMTTLKKWKIYTGSTLIIMKAS